MASPRSARPQVRGLILAGLIAAVLSALAFIWRAAWYSAVVDVVAELSPSMQRILDVIATKGLLVLVALAAGLGLWALARKRDSAAVLIAAGAGTVAAYACSELIKIIIQQARPCATLAAKTVLECPAQGDWSWPSNHSTIAGALAAACILAVPRLWVAVGPIALSIAFSRVTVGVHYPHDVLAGLALGVLVTTVIAVFLERPLQRLTPSAHRH